MTRGTVTLYIAASLDGVIATEDGGVEWLEEYASDDESEDDGSFEAFFAGVDCLVMGSRTYEQILSFDEWPYGERPTFVVTSRDLPLATDRVELVAGDLRESVDGLEERYDRIWLVGGAALAQSFLRERLVDGIRLTVVPVLLGGGIRLFGDDGTERALETVECTSFESGLVELRYDASGSTPSA
ncbi:dihydrofolate reductase [Haloterrigena sp. SYSU A121-1]|uniref:Dihydrofolate reductase n=1 Tax=Haloterrigena gelatinilytica TaxID=2741724 RepID=A0A8J8GM65_9EURY|nr:dihydrofolate reductase family protein [Haloterrigena gelatinilytica]NUB90347.1 dihydrofolate reductase [Haloterrigena gelatinilytica]